MVIGVDVLQPSFLIGVAIAGWGVLLLRAQVQGLRKVVDPDFPVTPLMSLLPARFAGPRDEFRLLGFEPVLEFTTRLGDSPVLHAVLLLRESDGTMAEVGGTNDPRHPPPSLGVMSLLEGGRGKLDTQTLGVFPPWEGELKQVFRGAPPRELVRHHDEALEYLRRRGVSVEPFSEDRLLEQYRALVARLREHVLASAWRIAASSLAAKFGRHSSRGPIMLRPETERTISFLLQGGGRPVWAAPQEATGGEPIA